MSDPSFSDDTLSGRGLGHKGSRGGRVASRAALIVLIIVAAVTGVLWARAQDRQQKAIPSTKPAQVARHAVVIQKPGGIPSVATGRTNFLGQPVFASCSSCHTTTKPNPDLRDSRDLDQFHQGLKYAHGELTCLSCHNANNYDTLKLADGRSLEYSESMSLCSQCHGPQRRDYEQGLHGGMKGHWDLSRGGRERNTCVNCHDPHAPAFPVVVPVLPPKDRISVPRKPTHEATAHASH